MKHQSHGYLEFVVPQEAGSPCTPYEPFSLEWIEAAHTDSSIVIRAAVRGGSFIVIELDSETANRLAAQLTGNPPQTADPLA